MEHLGCDQQALQTSSKGPPLGLVIHGFNTHRVEKGVGSRKVTLMDTKIPHVPSGPKFVETDFGAEFQPPLMDVVSE